MFALRSSRLASSTSRRPAVRLRLERLEDRCTPASISLYVNYNIGRSISMSGNLSGAPNNAYQTILFGGKTGGSATTDANGHYEQSVNAISLGDVTARKADGTSNTASFTLTDQAPVITEFVACEGVAHTWTLSGTITYFRYFDTIPIQFGGGPVTLQGKGATANSTGAFETTLVLNGQGNDNGVAWAQATSPWGTKSEFAYDEIFQTGT